MLTIFSSLFWDKMSEKNQNCQSTIVLFDNHLTCVRCTLSVNWDKLFDISVLNLDILLQLGEKCSCVDQNSFLFCNIILVTGQYHHVFNTFQLCYDCL